MRRRSNRSRDAVPARKIIVNIATSADGFIARPDGELDWLTERAAPKGFYGLPKFAQSVDAKIIGRKTFDVSVSLGAHFKADDVHYVFSSRRPAAVPEGVHFVTEPIPKREEPLVDGRRRNHCRVPRRERDR